MVEGEEGEGMGGSVEIKSRAKTCVRLNWMKIVEIFKAHTEQRGT